MKKINTTKQFREKYMILKPDKYNAVALMNKLDSHNAIKQLFSDKTKFKIIENDPTLTRLRTVQNHSNNLRKRNEITEADRKQMRPISVWIGSSHGLPKIHKVTPYSKIKQFLRSILQRLTKDDHTVKDSFDAVNKIKSVCVV